MATDTFQTVFVLNVLQVMYNLDVVWIATMWVFENTPSVLGVPNESFVFVNPNGLPTYTDPYISSVSIHSRAYKFAASEHIFTKRTFEILTWIIPKEVLFLFFVHNVLWPIRPLFCWGCQDISWFVFSMWWRPDISFVSTWGTGCSACEWNVAIEFMATYFPCVSLFDSCITHHLWLIESVGHQGAPCSQ